MGDRVGLSVERRAVKAQRAPAARIFICYRREGGSERAQRLHADLVRHFGPRAVFIDLDVPPGADVRQYITEQLSSCVVLLVVIGPDWLTVSDEHGTRRIDNELDYVRVEIATFARKPGFRIVPLLVKDTRMPTTRELPEDISTLANRNAMELSDGVRWEQDVQRLIKAIEPIVRSRRVEPRPTLGDVIRRVLGRRPYATLCAAAVIAVAVAVGILLSDGHRGGARPPSQPSVVATAPCVGGTAPHTPSLVIYSSLPSTDPPASGVAGAPGQPDLRTVDERHAIQLLLTQSHCKAGAFRLVYSQLDDSDSSGSLATQPGVNARIAAKDPDTAAYIGDFNSPATQESLPILSAAHVPQVSPASSRLGLTQPDPGGDADEPGHYYPTGYLNFVRVVPTTTVLAMRTLDLMVHNGCRRLAIITDNSTYGNDLANAVRGYNKRQQPHAVKIVQDQPLDPGANFALDISADAATQPDCFLYSGTRQSNTIPIFNAFAAAVPRAQLYGATGLADPTFYNSPSLSAQAAARTIVMVPAHEAPQGDNESAQFVAAFEQAHHTATLDPYAYYAYEAAALAVDAISRAGTGTPQEIRARIVTELLAHQQSTQRARDLLDHPSGRHDADERRLVDDQSGPAHEPNAGRASVVGSAARPRTYGGGGLTIGLQQDRLRRKSRPEVEQSSASR
jgi:branched-chain amino acid transport system substrate-binding protein